MDARVKVHYRNEQGRIVSTREYLLKDYQDMIRMDLFRVITDVENVFYRLNGGRPKSEWLLQDVEEFNRIKHKLLDKAGDIERLPTAMTDGKPADGIVARTLIGMMDRGE